jgi:predicted MFS family arabinose efflux permease
MRPVLSNLGRVYLYKFLVSVHFIAGVLVPFYTEWGKISFSQVMWLQSWFVLWIFVLEVPTGAVADRFGRKASLLCGSAASVLAVAVYVSKPDFAVFLVAEWLWALADAFISGADESLLYDSLKEEGREKESKTAIGRLWNMHTGAVMLSAPIGSLLGARFGLAAPVALMMVPFALSLAVAAAMREPETTRSANDDYWKTMRAGLRYFFGHKAILALALDSVVSAALCFMVIWLAQPALLAQGLPVGLLGFVFSALTGLQIVVISNFDRLERWVGGARRYITLSAVVPGLAYLALGWSPNAWLTAALIVLLCGLGLSRPVLISNYIHKHVGSAQRATVLSTASGLRKLVAGVLYPVVGALQAWSPRGTFAVLGAAVLVCAAVSRIEEADLL